MIFSDHLKTALSAVSQILVADLPADDAADASVVAEVTLDTGRLATFGFPEADKEVGRLVSEHGWNAVLSEAMKHVDTA